MLRWPSVWLRNRIAALLALAIVAGAAGGVGIGALRLLGDGAIGMLGAAIGAGAVVLAFASHPWPKQIAERMAAEERALSHR